MINGHNAQLQRVQNLFHSVQLNVNNPHFLVRPPPFRPSPPPPSPPNPAPPLPGSAPVRIPSPPRSVDLDTLA